MVVTSSLKSSTLREASKEAGFAAGKAEELKYRKFPPELAVNPNFDFTPLAMETLGVFTSSSMDLLKDVVKSLANVQGTTISKATEYVFQRVSVVLQTENGRMLLDKTLPRDDRHILNI